MKQPLKFITISSIIIFLSVLSSIVIYSTLTKKQYNSVRPTPVLTLELTPAPIFSDDFFEPSITPEFSEKIAPGIIKVDWNKELVELKGESRLLGEFYYNAGVVAEGENKGLSIYLKSFEDGPFGLNFSHVMVKNGSKINLEENEVKIEGLFDLPERIVAPGKSYPLIKGLVAYDLFSAEKTDKVLFKDDKLGNIYDSNGCAIIEMPDHTKTSYDFDIPFDYNNIIFSNGEKNTEEYRYKQELRGCGATCSTLQYISEKELMPAGRLKKAGVADNGDPVYEIKNLNDELLKTFYDSYVEGFTGEFIKPSDTEKRTFEGFVKMHPYLFWKDPFGRWVKFTNTRFISIPQAEMCKPAIYLYPEEKTKLNVEVSPNGGFSFTNPPYGSGWNVEASPDGQIIDLKTGKKYDYLFWEGIGINYPDKEEGWVIKKENLDEFFSEKLLMLGMNKNEIIDFKEYWLKKLTAGPYYKISFLTLDEFNSLAPLNFYPEKPQTIIRVMMTAQGLNKSKQVIEQKLPLMPARNGFTAVEWGGTLLR